MRLGEQIGLSATPAAPAGKSGVLATVVVSCCGQLEYTRLCVPSLLRFTRQPYELLFLDSDSRDGTAEYLEGLATAAPIPVEVIRVPADPPLGNAQKEEVIQVRGEFVALLNNDVIVTQAWLDRLIALALSAPNIGLVAPMSNHGPQELRVDNIPYAIDDPNLFANSPLRAPHYSLVPLIDQVNRFAGQWREQHINRIFDLESAAGSGGGIGCVLVKREVLRKLNLFPTRTPLGIFDTADLMQRVQQAGFRSAVCGDLFVHSFGSRG